MCREKNKKKKYKIYGRRTHKNRTEHRKNYMGEFEFYKNKKGLRLSLLFSTVADMYGAGVRGGGGGGARRTLDDGIGHIFISVCEVAERRAGF